MTDITNLQEIAQVWRRSRRIYAVFAALDQYFQHKIGPCRDLDSPIDRADPEAIKRILTWIGSVDEASSAAQLRQLFQSHALATEENLRTLLRYYLDKEPHSEQDRDKTDFLLVHYFSFCAPVALQEGEPGMEEFASVLEPVLGECSTLYPGWLEKLPEYIRELTQCASLNDLARREVIEKARDLKREAGDRYFGSSALLAFAHYNFHARRTFFRLLHSDLISIRSGLIALEQRGVKQVNCSAAGLSNNMPVGELKRVVQQWKRVFESDYAQGYSFLSIAGLREAVTTALESSAVVSADFKLQEAAVATPVEEEREEDPGLGYVVAKIAEELDKRRDELLGKNLAIAKVTIEGQILILASWEVAAFLDSSGEYAEALRRAVAGRASIAMSIGTNRFAAALASAQVQTAQLQELVAQARERKDIDAAVNLAASAKRLTALVEQSSSMAHGAGR